MGERRGPKTALDLKVVRRVGGWERPGPPEDMTDHEKDIWRQTVSAMPATWFTAETHELLRQYCFHAMAADRLAAILRHAHDSAMARDHAVQTNAMVALARSLRISKMQRQREPRDEALKRSTPQRRVWEER